MIGLGTIKYWRDLRVQHEGAISHFKNIDNLTMVRHCRRQVSMANRKIAAIMAAKNPIPRPEIKEIVVSNGRVLANV